MRRVICKAGKNIIGLAVSGDRGIEFYPLPAGKMVFYRKNGLHRGFFAMESISGYLFDAAMRLRAQRNEELNCDNLYKMGDLLKIDLELLGK